MIKLDHVTKSFGSNIVLQDISLTINKGEIFGLIGKNGAGKTTLLSIIAGLSNATSGTCLINERNLSRENRICNIGYLPDVPAFFDMMTANEYLAFLYKKQNSFKAQSEKLLQLVGVNGKATIKSMSRGSRQRLGMAATLVNNPEIILLDEPSSALDPMGRYELANLLLELKKQGKTIILSTHILTDMESICDRVGFLHNGRIVKTLSPNDNSTSIKIKISFTNAVNVRAFAALPLKVFSENSNTIIISGDLHKMNIQNNIMQMLCELDNPIVHIEVIGTNLETIFREVCQ